MCVAWFLIQFTNLTVFLAVHTVQLGDDYMSVTLG